MVRWLQSRRATVGYVILTVAVAVTLLRMEQIDNRQHEALRSILCLAQRNTLTSRQRTPAEKRQIIAFYEEALREIDARPCDPLDLGGS